MMAGKIRISSFNCEGFKYRNYDYIKNIFEKCDILLLQETWLYNFQFNEYNKVLNRCNYHSVSAMDETNIGRIGRPYGGCAIIWHSKLELTFTPITTNSTRICAVSVTSDNVKIIIISVYMPTDEDINFIPYGDVLDEISSIISSYDNFEFIIGGDFNVDYKRTASKNLDLFKCFIREEQLTCVTLPIADNNYTRIDTLNNKSFIDHFLVSHNINNYRVSVAHDGHNLSDHEPISLSTEYDLNFVNQKYDVKYVNNWNMATENDILNYKRSLDQQMQHFELPISITNCNNYMCTDHNSLIIQKVDEILNILINSADKTIPTKRISSNGKGGIMGWNDFVKPYKEKSIFWNNIWKDAGSPQQGELANVRRFARYKYHWAIKTVNKQNNNRILEKTAEQLVTKSFRKFWQIVKNLKGKDNRSSNIIDGKVNDNDIVNHFYDIYANLYSSVCDDDFKYLVEDVNTLVNDKCNSNECKSSQCHNVSYDLLKKAISCLNNGKEDETYYMYSDNFLHATDLVINNLSLLITAMMKHGAVSQLINKAVIIPIPKNKQKSLSDSSNYRAICKNTILSKILDYVLIYQLENKLNTSHYQFAYKSGFSTSLCSFLVAETIQYYRSRGSNVYMLSLDATKAYDRVQYTKLFKLLIDKEICPLLIRFIMNIYLVSTAIVKWNNTESQAFSLLNGVKQGAVISPPLFALYIDPLIENLTNSKKGCHIGNLCANAFAYADDVILLSPTCTALKSMIEICEQFSDDYKLQFNPNKCTLLIFSDSDYYFNNVCIRLCGRVIKNVRSETHLGHTFENSYDLINIDSIIRDIKVRTNTVINTFRPLSWESKVMLYISQCSSLYGCPLWRLDSANIDRLCTDWNICCRRILGLRQDTRTYLIPHLMNTLPIKCIIMQRMINFFSSGINHHISMISDFFKNALLSKSSHMSANISTILNYLDINYNDILDLSKIRIKNAFLNKSEDPDWRANYIKELLHVRDRQFFIDLQLDHLDVTSILNFMSTFR